MDGAFGTLVTAAATGLILIVVATIIWEDRRAAKRDQAEARRKVQDLLDAERERWAHELEDVRDRPRRLV